ncbi:MAG: hypothetical protein F4Y91_14650 [Gemmatimonadetes bacterium]|nr:hypothetical protein [Gemmatimonadota bacterium]MXY83259.1 hypothetical protein [Gemmatimonadota bacterium]MYB67911.1 hypothetical protein [Gemmatimonadota bacterium]
MSTPQPSPELTTRDVLQQIDHRLSLIETDVRENHTKIDSLRAELTDKIDGLEAKTETKIDGLEAKTEAKIDGLEAKTETKINELRREFNGKFNLVIGLVITSWLSMMGTLLFKL